MLGEHCTMDLIIGRLSLTGRSVSSVAVVLVVGWSDFDSS